MSLSADCRPTVSQLLADCCELSANCLPPRRQLANSHPTVGQQLADKKQNLNSSFPFGQVGLKFCLPWAVLDHFKFLHCNFTFTFTFTTYLKKDLPGSLAIGQVSMKSYSKKMYLPWTALFFEP